MLIVRASSDEVFEVRSRGGRAVDDLVSAKVVRSERMRIFAWPLGLD